jgi:hypothetical protein
MYWDVGFEYGWWERLRALHCDVHYSGAQLTPTLQERYLALRPAELLTAADRYGIDYIVMPAQWPHAGEFEAAHANSGYRAIAAEQLRGARPR